MPILGYQPIQKLMFLNTLTVDEIKGAMHFAIKYKTVVRNYLEKLGDAFLRHLISLLMKSTGFGSKV